MLLTARHYRMAQSNRFRRFSIFFVVASSQILPHCFTYCFIIFAKTHAKLYIISNMGKFLFLIFP